MVSINGWEEKSNFNQFLFHVLNNRSVVFFLLCALKERSMWQLTKLQEMETSPPLLHADVYGGSPLLVGAPDITGLAQRGSLGAGWGVLGWIWGYTIVLVFLLTQAELGKWRPWRIQRVASVTGYSWPHSAISSAAGIVVSLSIHDFFWPRGKESLCGDMRQHTWLCHQWGGEYPDTSLTLGELSAHHLLPSTLPTC